jgi:hypothetical protein
LCKKQLLPLRPLAKACLHTMKKCATCFNSVFDDQRLMVLVVWIWLGTVLAIFTEMGLLQSEFVRFGPSESCKYVGITLNTWRKWGAVAVFSAMSSFWNDIAEESLEPFFINVIRDVKGRYIPFSKLWCHLVTQLWTIYASIMSIFGLYTYFSQIDFMIIKLVVALAVQWFATYRYLRNKECEPAKFAQYFRQHDEIPDDNALQADVESGDLPPQTGGADDTSKLARIVARATEPGSKQNVPLVALPPRD